MLRRPVVFFLAILKLTVSTGLRWPFSYATFLADGLDMTLSQVLLIFAVGDAMGILAPITGPLSDKFGAKTFMIFGVLCCTIGQYVMTTSGAFAAVLIGRLIFGAGVNINHPAVQVYIGHTADDRVKVTSFVESSWALSDVIGAMVCGLILKATSWRIPFIVMGTLSLICAVSATFLRDVRGDDNDDNEENADKGISNEVAEKKETQKSTVADVLRNVRKQTVLVLRRPRPWFGLMLGFMLSIANSVPFALYGSWLDDEFEYSIEQVGLVTTVIGLFELAGAGTLPVSAKYLGMKHTRTVFLGGIFVSLILLVVAAATTSLYLGVASVCLVYYFNEVALVSTFVMITELGTPHGIGTLHSHYNAWLFLGRTVANLIAGPLYESGGLVPATIAAIVGVIGAIAMHFIIEIGRSKETTSAGDSVSDADNIINGNNDINDINNGYVKNVNLRAQNLSPQEMVTTEIPSSDGGDMGGAKMQPGNSQSVSDTDSDDGEDNFFPNLGAIRNPDDVAIVEVFPDQSEESDFQTAMYEM